MLSWDLLSDITGEAARAVARAVYAKLRCAAASGQGAAADSTTELYEQCLALVDPKSAAAAMPISSPVQLSGQAGSTLPTTELGEALHCCYGWLPARCVPGGMAMQPLLAAAWTDRRGALLASRLFSDISGGEMPGSSRGANASSVCV